MVKPINISLYIVIGWMMLVFGPLPVSAQLSLDAGSMLTVKNGTHLFVGTSLTLKSNSFSSGYWVDQTLDNGIEISGSITVERYLSPDQWHNVSVPLNNITSTVWSNTDLVFYYDEAIIQNDWNFGWVWYSGNLNVMKGYDVFVPETALTASYFSTNPLDLNTGSFSTNVSLTNMANGETSEHKGWNLIGNPYPSPVDWLITEAWDKTPVNDAKYIWDPIANVYTVFLGGSNPVGLNGGTQFIPAQQGFWVQALQNGNVQVNNAARVGITASTPDYYKLTEIAYPLLKLRLTGNNYHDETILRFIEGASDGFDKNTDAGKLFGSEREVPQLATLSKGKCMAVNTLEKINPGLVIPLYLKTGTEGQYILETDALTTLTASDSCYLWDKKTKQFSPLNAAHPYAFDSRYADQENRFSVVFCPKQAARLIPEQPFQVRENKGVLTFYPSAGMQSASDFQIYNLAGQIVFEGTLPPSGPTSFAPALPSGICIIRVFSEDRIAVLKLFIRN